MNQFGLVWAVSVQYYWAWSCDDDEEEEEDDDLVLLHQHHTLYSTVIVEHDMVHSSLWNSGPVEHVVQSDSQLCLTMISHYVITVVTVQTTSSLCCNELLNYSISVHIWKFIFLELEARWPGNAWFCPWNRHLQTLRMCWEVLFSYCCLILATWRNPRPCLCPTWLLLGCTDIKWLVLIAHSRIYSCSPNKTMILTLMATYDYKVISVPLFSTDPHGFQIQKAGCIL